jgi:hypothetical protein
MKHKRISEDEVGAMLEEAFEGEPFERIEPPPRFSHFFRGGAEQESFFDKLKRFLVLPSVPRRLAFTGAVVALLLLALIPLMPGDGQLTYRNTGPAEATELPRGRLAAAPGALHWPSTDGVSSYRVELADQNGVLLWEGETSSTGIDLPAGLLADRPIGSEYRVEVTGYGPDGAETSRQTSRFMVLP